MADQAPHPCGCIWACLAPGAWSCRRRASCRRRHFNLTDNDYSLLDETDLVLIDPVSTGYSRPVEGQKSREWHGFKKDIASVGDFIRLYATRHNRWLSPKFLIGESYGTTRAAGLAGYLQERHGMYFNGIMLISAALDFTTLDFHPNNDLPYILFLPGYAAAAWYHGKLRTRKPLQKLLREVEAFAAGDYAAALMKGDALPKARRSEIIDTARALHGTGDGLHRTLQSAHQRSALLQGTAARPRADRRPAGQPPCGPGSPGSHGASGI